MKKTIVSIKSAEELEAMNTENTKIDVALREHFISICNVIKALEAEKSTISKIVLEAYDHKPVKSGEVFKTIVYDSLKIDESKIVELFGEEGLKAVKVKPVHTEYIKA